MTNRTSSVGLEGESAPFIPYADPTHAPTSIKSTLERYVERMGFLPNALKLYLHRPEIAEALWTLNDRVMRDPSSTLPQSLKRKLGAIASRLNGCKYCTTHHCHILQSPGGFGAEGWELSDQDLFRLLSDHPRGENEMEEACIAFVTEASLDPTAVNDVTLERLTGHLSPQQVVELASVVGFWKMYNTIHDALHVPIEAALLDKSRRLAL